MIFKIKPNHLLCLLLVPPICGQIQYYVVQFLALVINGQDFFGQARVIETQDISIAVLQRDTRKI